MCRKYVIANWKMNPATQAQAMSLAKALQAIEADVVKVGCAPSFLHIAGIFEQLTNKTIWLGAQDVCANAQSTGAYTGDVSAGQLQDLGVDFVLIGHSERRTYHHESQDVLLAKIQQAQQAGLVAVLCVGENQEQYHNERTLDVLAEQLALLDGVDVDAKRLLIAYEPVWAIGTGLTPTVAQIEQVHHHIKLTLAGYGLVDVCVLYGGSVNENNAQQFASSAKIDGALVGGASLKIDSFAAIVSAFANA